VPIPESPRVIYNKPALEEVICQLKFPPILSIGANEPAEFQDKIRRQYPHYLEKSQDIPKEIPPQLAAVISHKLQAGGKEYSFITEERDWSVSLTKDFISLSSQSYIRWEEFKKHFEEPLANFNSIYEPSFYSRIGLRYRDVIIRSKLGLADVPWSELLQKHIAGVLSEENVQDEVIHAEKTILLNLGDQVGKVRINHFLALVSETNEECYVIDADFYTDNQTEPNNAIEKLNELNSYAGRLFRWCIRDKLYVSMEPEPVT